MGIAVLETFARDQALTGQEWDRIHLWWSDERFVPSGSPERNAVQARAALIDSIPVSPSNVHEFPASDQAMTLQQAATAFEAEAASWFGAPGSSTESTFDLALLGVGPDGHIASLFPGHDYPTENWVVYETASPKPPAQRLSFSYLALERASEIWLLLAGAEKAEMLATVMASGDSTLRVAARSRDESDQQEVLPVQRLSGGETVTWFLDSAAQGSL